jgi:hypothetical protein
MDLVLGPIPRYRARSILYLETRVVVSREPGLVHDHAANLRSGRMLGGGSDKGLSVRCRGVIQQH